MRERITLRALLLGTGPRFARDALGPVLAFYLVWKLVGLVPGILAATLLSVLAFVWERRRIDRKSTRLNSSHIQKSRMPSSA